MGCVIVKAPFQLLSAGDALGIVVKRMDSRSAQPHGGERKETTAAAHIEKCLAVELRHLQHGAQRVASCCNLLFVQGLQETLPVLAEGKTLSGAARFELVVGHQRC